MSLRDEPTVKVEARVPVTLAQRASEQLPGLNIASVIRVALARLTGLDADQFVTRLPNGPKPRKTSE